ncbi:multicopper oxidase domain-containing protein [Kaarinaea lacus]
MMKRNNASQLKKYLQRYVAAGLLLLASNAHAIDVSGGITLGVMPMTKTLGGNDITFWVYCVMGSTEPGGCMNLQLPGPTLELGVGAQASVTLMPGMMATEPAPYDGHTIHFHGLDVPQGEDGVPETGASTNGDTYTFNVDSRYVGSHKYHCHVHTVKHLEMGMYGAFIVRAVDAQGNFVNTINEGGPTYDFEWNWVLSTVDPRYHTAVGDDPVFASYVPQYFLINGNEGLTRAAPAETLAATVGANVAIRLMGLHSVNSTFQILDSNDVPQEFVLHNMDGFKLNTPRTVTEIEISPGQTRDIMITLPATPGTLFPEVTYRRLLDDSAYSTVFTELTFN